MAFQNGLECKTQFKWHSIQIYLIQLMWSWSSCFFKIINDSGGLVQKWKKKRSLG